MRPLPRAPLTHPPPHQPALRRPNVLGFNDASSLWNFTIPSRGQLGTSQRPLQPEDEAGDLAERILIRGKWPFQKARKRCGTTTITGTPWDSSAHAHPRAERSPSEAAPAETALSWTRPGSPVAPAHPLGLGRVPSLTSRMSVWLHGECQPPV